MVPKPSTNTDAYGVTARNIPRRQVVESIARGGIFASLAVRLLGGGIMGDMGKPLPAWRLAVFLETSHTAVITQSVLLHAFIEPFLKGQTPKGMFEKP